MTPVFCCGFECGQIAASSGAAVGEHWYIANGTAISISTSTVRSGARSLRVNPTAASTFIERSVGSAQTRFIGRLYVYFATLPDEDTVLAWVVAGGPFVLFDTSESKIYATVSSTRGASGVSVTTGQWYRIDFDFNINTSGNDTTDVMVNGTACGQASAAGVSAGSSVFKLGLATVAVDPTGDVYFDDLVLSHTGADYPIGAGTVHHFVPSSDGNHSITGSNDFERGTTGTDIISGTTDAYQLIDDVPLPGPTDTGTDDYINMIAPASSLDYVQCVFGPAAGISTPTTAPRAVQVIAAYHQGGTGDGNMEIRIGGAVAHFVYTAVAVAGVTSINYVTNHYALAPGDVAWTVSNFNNLVVRFGSPGAGVDANPDQYLDAIMIEAEFLEEAPVEEGTRFRMNL